MSSNNPWLESIKILGTFWWNKTATISEKLGNVTDVSITLQSWNILRFL